MATRPKLHSTQLYELQSEELCELSSWARSHELQFPGWSGYTSSRHFLFKLCLELCGHVSPAEWRTAVRKTTEEREADLRHIVSEQIKAGEPRWTSWGSHQVDQAAQVAIGVMAAEAIAA